MSRIVQFSITGGPDVVDVVEIADPHPAPGEVRVAVRAAGLNPYDSKVRRGLIPATLPVRPGSEFAGIIDELGEGVTELHVGDSVLGWSSGSAQADYVVVAASHVAAKPAGLDWAVAGGLGLVANTAWRATSAVSPDDGDTVLIGGVSGGVGLLAAQFALQKGAVVVGTARESSHEFLRELGILPVSYGDGELERLRALKPHGYSAAIDTVGRVFIERALALGIPPERIDSIAYQNAGREFGVQSVGGGKKNTAELAGWAAEAAAGSLILPVRATFTLENVAAAYRELDFGHGLGKVVLTVA